MQVVTTNRLQGVRMAQSRAHIQATTRWESKAYDKVTLRLRKDTEPTRETITEAATAAGMSLNAYVLEAVKEKMNGGKAPPDEIVPDLGIYARQVGQSPEEYTAQAIRERMQRQDKEAAELEHEPFFD